MKKFAYFLVLIMLCSLFAGCGSKKETGEKEQMLSTPEAFMSYQKDEVEQESITCWYTEGTDKDWLETASKSFASEYGVSVNLVFYDGVSFFEDLNQANQDGTGPDMYLLSNDQIQLAKDSGMAQDLSYVDDELWKSCYPEVADKAVTYQGKRYAYPIYFDTYCLVYDANLLENAPASIDEILAFLDEYEDTGSTKAIFRWDVADPYINSMFLGSYANLFGENGDDATSFQINNEKCVETMQYFQSLSQYLWMNKSNISHDTIRNRIKDGTLVLGLCKSDILPTLYTLQKEQPTTEATTEDVTEETAETTEEGEVETTETVEEETPVEDITNYQIAYVPSLTEELSSTAFSTTYGAFINPYATEEAGANLFAFYLSYVNAKNQYDGNGKLPVVNQKDKFDEMKSIIYAQYLNSKPVPKVIVLGDYLTEGSIAFDAIWGGADAKESLDALQSTMNQKIRE